MLTWQSSPKLTQRTDLHASEGAWFPVALPAYGFKQFHHVSGLLASTVVDIRLSIILSLSWMMGALGDGPGAHGTDANSSLSNLGAASHPPS